MEIRRVDGADTTRDEVRTWWTDLVQGRSSRLEAARWAAHRLEDGAVGEDELVTQALLFLQAVDLIHDQTHGESVFRHAQTERATFLTSDIEVALALAGWTEELRQYDLDPNTWNTAYFVRIVGDFAARHGAAHAWRFADKLIKSGQLQIVDVESALGRRPPTPGAERAGGQV